MKTFYVMQGALEEYLNESQSNGNGRGNYGTNDFPGNCEKICANAGENSQARVKCGCEGTPAQIDNGIGIAIVLAIALGVIALFKYKVRN